MFFRFDTMMDFEAALAGAADRYGRFTTTPELAARGLGLSLTHINQLVRRGAVDCVIVANRYRLLDGEALLRYDVAVRMAPRELRKRLRRAWIARHADAGAPGEEAQAA